MLNIKTGIGIVVGIVLTLSVLMALTVWNAHKKFQRIDRYFGLAIQKGLLPSEEAIKTYVPPQKQVESLPTQTK